MWFEPTERKLFSKAGSADSSLIEIADYDSASTVKTTTLDRYVREHGIDLIEVLKIEAEGAEPEVLRGARESLKISRYVTVDCGRERQIDWICRFPAGGTASRESPGWARTELVGDGYEHVSDAVVTDADELQLEWQLPHSSLTLFLPCEGRDNRIIRGAVPANPASERSDLLIRRRQAAATVYLAVFHSWVGEPTVTGVRPHLDLPPGVSGLWIETASGRDLWIIGRPDHQQDLAAAHEGSADRLFIYCLD